MCCESDSIIAHVKIDRQGYAPGEVIPFQAEIENTNDCSEANLIMVSLSEWSLVSEWKQN